MIRVQVTERLIFEAKELAEQADGATFMNRPEYKKGMELLGAIGEIALIDYCWSNDLLAYKNKNILSDIQIHTGHTIEVKTQKCSSTPKMNYKVNFGARKRDINLADFVFFNRVQYVAGIPECVWLLGGCSWDKFFRMATLHHEGDQMMNFNENGTTTSTGRYYNTDCYDLPISQLAPPSAALKHFKSLQQKEEAQ